MNNRVLLVDEQPLARFGAKLFLQDQGYDVVGEAINSQQALLMAEEYRPDWIVLDISVSKFDGVKAIYHLLAIDRPAHIIVFTGHELNHYVRTCIQAGVAGFVRKTAPLESLLCAMDSAALGHVWLPTSALNGIHLEGQRHHALLHRISARERKVMSLLLQGKSNNEISQILNRSPKTTSAQKKSLLQKLNVGSLAELISVATAQQVHHQV